VQGPTNLEFILMLLTQMNGYTALSIDNYLQA
jgi:hypothetical protein